VTQILKLEEKIKTFEEALQKSEKMRNILMERVEKNLESRKAEEEDHLRLEESLKENAHLLQALLDAIPGPIFYKDLNGVYLGCNRAFESYIGLSKDKITGKSACDLAPKELADRYRQMDMELFRQGGLQSYESKVKYADGSLHDVIFNKAEFTGRDGKPGGLVGVILDITERKQTEEALKESRQFLQSVLDTSPVRIFWKDRDSGYLGCNKNFALDAGFQKPEDLIGKDDYDMSWRDRAELYRTDDRQVIETGVPKMLFEEPLTTHAGKQIWSITSKAPLKDAYGNIQGVLGTYMDISEYRNAMEALRVSEERFRTMVERTRDWVWEGDLNGVVTYSNPRIKELLGYSHEEIVGRNTADFMPPEEAKHFFEENADLAETGKPIAGAEVVYAHKDGRRIVFETNAVPIFDANGKLTGYRGIDRDITIRKQAEEELKRAKVAAEEANRSKSEFLANMSHEIRTPMNGVIGMAELLQDTALTREQREFINTIRSSAEALMTIINDILDFSKIEARKLDLDSIDFKLRDSMGDILQTLSQRAAEKGLELAYHVGSEVPDNVTGDPGRLRQIIVNLVGNSIKFTDQGEVVILITQEKEKEGQTYLHFVVTDTGIGIAAEKQKKIFESFAQADASTTRKYGGTGLGLSISTRLVEMMGGKIWVESEHGKGSSFHFTIRLGVHNGLPVRQIPEKLCNLDGMSILVVDDNATNRRILHEMLRNWGMNPSLAENGKNALEMLREANQTGKPYRLLLLDVNMPEMDGFELTERIRDMEEYHHVVIMMLTSSGQRGDATRCRNLGVAGYLTKPVKQSSLLEAVLTVMGTAVPAGVPAPLCTHHTLRKEQQQPLHILIAEDNAVNQRIAAIMFEKRGHTVTVVGNGREAVAALETKKDVYFDVILMDVQMPMMDGFEATALIREKEKGTGRHIPIIALTAHAMKGDKEQCLNAGMDGYVSKPLKVEELFNILKELTCKKTLCEPKAATSLKGSKDVLDIDQAMSTVDNEIGFFREIGRLFIKNAPKAMADIRDAIEKSDAYRLNRAAHALKGSSANFGAGLVCQAALRLEKMGEAGDTSQGVDAYHLLEGEMERFIQALEEYLRDNGR
jgi:PAS domain S-box-containing protein